jgi:hypothetical protein
LKISGLAFSGLKKNTGGLAVSGPKKVSDAHLCYDRPCKYSRQGNKNISIPVIMVVSSRAKILLCSCTGIKKD